MTREEIQQFVKNAQSAQAWLNGKNVQVKRHNQDADPWEDYVSDCPDFISGYWDWRTKPEPKLRPWKPEEIPIGSLIRLSPNQEDRSAGEAIILHNYLGRVGFGTKHCAETGQSVEDCLRCYEYSADNGKTWHRCGVEEIV